MKKSYLIKICASVLAFIFPLQTFTLANPISFHIPRDIGNTEVSQTNHEKREPLIVHIQTAHGQYEAEKKVQEILEYLTQKVGFDLILAEGGIDQLYPDRLNYFPNQPDKNIRLAEALLEKSELTGLEMFLVERANHGKLNGVQAYGIENAKAYRNNRSDFQEIIRNQEESEIFLSSLELELDRLKAQYLNRELLSFLAEVFLRDDIDSLERLKKLTKIHLSIDLGSPAFQKEYPMLIRLFRLQAIHKKFRSEKFESEKEEFLKKIEEFGLDPKILKPLQSILEGQQLNGIKPRRVLENLYRVLPELFSLRSWNELSLYLESKILESELDGKVLSCERKSLADALLNILARSQCEREIVSVQKACSFLRKLLTLTLTREEYDSRVRHSNPFQIVQQCLTINAEKRVRDINFSNLDQADALYDRALRFYEGAREREKKMMELASARMKALGKSRAILITGGFHSIGVERFAQAKHLSYLRVSPVIDSINNRRDYHLAMLEAHIEQVLKLQLESRLAEQGLDTEYARRQIAWAASLGEDESLPPTHSLQGIPKIISSETASKIELPMKNHRRLILALKTVLSLAMISGMAGLIEAGPVRPWLASRIGMDFMKIFFWGIFTLMNDLFGQWMAGRGVIKKQVILSFPMGLVLGAITLHGLEFIHYAVPQFNLLPVWVAVLNSASLLSLLIFKWYRVRTVDRSDSPTNRIVKKYLSWIVPLMMLIVFLGLFDFAFVHHFNSHEKPLNNVAANIIRVYMIWHVIFFRAWIYANLVSWMRGNRKSLEEIEKSNEAVILTRLLSAVKNYSVFEFFSPEKQPIVEGILNQYFTLFYNWATNKAGFIIKNRELRRSWLFLVFFPITVPIWFLVRWFQNRKRPSSLEPSFISGKKSSGAKGASLGSLKPRVPKRSMKKVAFEVGTLQFVKYYSLKHDIDPQAMIRVAREIVGGLIMLPEENKRVEDWFISRLKPAFILSSSVLDDGVGNRKAYLKAA